MKTVKDLLEKLQKEIHEKEFLEKQLEIAKRKNKEANAYYTDATQARAILQEGAEQTQQVMEAQMSAIVTSALSGIFTDPYEFIVRFEQKRNKTECVLLFRRGGEEFSPVDSSGGGALDIASFALRVAFWCIGNNQNTIVLDEPFRFLSADLQAKAGELLKKLSIELGIQFIVITHLKELLPYGDKIYKIEKGVLTNG